MSNNANLYGKLRKPFKEILETAEKITYVYSLEKHIWEGEKEEDITKSRKEGKLRYSTLEEFLLEPVRDFFIDLLNHLIMNEGQGWWVQAEFGSGKSHLLSASTILLLGDEKVWHIIENKEEELGTEKRLSLTQFRRSVLEKKVFPVVLSLVGKGGPRSTKSLVDYIMEAASSMYETLNNIPLPVYPEEHLADRFLSEDINRFRDDLIKFLGIDRYLEGLPKYTYEELLDALQDTLQRRDAGKVLWRFYMEYLKIEPRIPVDSLTRLEYFVRRVLEEGYTGVLVVLDEVSEYMQKDVSRRTDNEDTLLVLSHTLAKEKGLPIWTLCAAQTTIEKERGASKIIAPERLKLYELLRREKSYYEVVLKRLRKIKDEENIEMYYQFFKRIVNWPEQRGLQDFKFFFPFYPEAIDVIRIVSSRLTTARSALYFLHHALLRAIEQDSKDILSLWNIFEDIISYEEAPSGGMAGVVSIKTRYQDESRAYEAAEKSLSSVTRGTLKVHKDRAAKILNTLFLYRLAHRPPLTPEQVLNAVMETKDLTSTLQDNLDHYEHLLLEMAKELPQIEEREAHFIFVEKETEDSRELYKKTRNELAKSPLQFSKYYKKLLEEEGSFFKEVAPDKIISKEFFFHNQQRKGRVGLKNLNLEGIYLPDLNSVETDDDFMLLASLETLKDQNAEEVLTQKDDPRVFVWLPRSIGPDEKETLIDILAYKKLEAEQEGKRPEIHIWAKGFFEKEVSRAHKIVESVYAEGKIMSIDRTLTPTTEGGLSRVFEKTATTVLDDLYEAASIGFDKQFRNADAPKLVNALIKSGKVTDRSSRNVSAARNFGVPLGLCEKHAPEILNPSGSQFYRRIEEFIEKAPRDELPVRSLYQNFIARKVGLTKRMVDLYLLTMVQEGKIKIRQKDRKTVDRSKIKNIDFSTTILNQMEQIIKPREPQFWQDVRPYIEILTGKEIGETYIERKVGESLSAIRELFLKEKSESVQLAQRVSQFFFDLNQGNPFDENLNKYKVFFATDVEGDHDEVVENLAKALTSFLHKSVSPSSKTDIENFRQSYAKYKGLRNNFDRIKDDVRTAMKYSNIKLPEEADLKKIKKKLEELKSIVPSVLQSLWDETYTEANFRPIYEKTLEAYFKPYREAHSSALYISGELKRIADTKAEEKHWQIAREFAETTEICKSILERNEQLLSGNLSNRVQCAIRDDNNLMNTLKTSPYCQCNFKLEERTSVLSNLNRNKEVLESLPDVMIQELAQFLLSNEVRSKLLKSGEDALKPFLKASKASELIKYLMKLDANELTQITKIVGAILKKSRVEHVTISRFSPSRRIVSSDRVKDVVSEFDSFLKSFLKDKETILVLHSDENRTEPSSLNKKKKRDTKRVP